MGGGGGGEGGQFLDFIFRLYDFTDKYQRSIFWGFQFQESVFFGGTGHSCCIFGLLNKSCVLKCFIFSTVFFLVQFYSPGASVIMVPIIIVSCITFAK